jgi:thiol-disulfide isomerase/thioredoxin
VAGAAVVVLSACGAAPSVGSDPATATMTATTSAGGSGQADGTGGWITLADYRADQARYDAGRVVLFFDASWCPTCRALHADLSDRAAQIPADLTIVSVDYDAHTDLRRDYGVRVQHTLVEVDPAGKALRTWVGGNTLDSVITQLG